MKHKIAWLVPFPIKGSGGHRTIFSHISHLASRGHQCHIYIDIDENPGMTGNELREMVQDSFGPCPAEIHRGYEVEGKFDLAVATAWWTAKIVADHVQARHKLYFVQDYEACFYPMGDEFILAENSYCYGLHPLTIGRWLSHRLGKRFGSTARFFDFTADNDIYHPVNPVPDEQAVCFVFQPEKPRRCPVIGRDALKIIRSHCPEVTIYTYGSPVEPGFDFEHTHLGILSTRECNQLYNRCTVGLCLSSSNPSRIPFEMMAAGLPAVDFHGENTIYDLPEPGVLLAERTPSSVAGAVIKILNSPDLRAKMRQGGLDFMRKRPAELEFKQCANIIESFADNVSQPNEPVSPLYRSPPFHADLPMPPDSARTVMPTSTVAAKNPEPPTMTLRERMIDNRITRVLKVMWQGHY
jgi:hypothetical protein